MLATLFIGTGVIAHTHAQALRQLYGRGPSAVFDPNPEAARRFAATYGIPLVHPGLDAALTNGSTAVAHIMSPPMSHASLARQVLAAGKHVLLEKPMACTRAEADELERFARNVGPILAINQNQSFHPALRRVQALLDSKALGPAVHISLAFHPLLRQLDSRQFSHWMFARPVNLLLEQVVHPLSQVLALGGALGIPVVRSGVRTRIAAGAGFVREFSASFSAGNTPVDMNVRFGATFPVWRLEVICADGIVVADMLSNTVNVRGRTKFLDPVDGALSSAASSAGESLGAAANLWRYGASLVKLAKRSDPFFLGMVASIEHAHAAFAGHATLVTDAQFGRTLVDFCWDLADRFDAEADKPDVIPSPSVAVDPLVTVFGGTGFIGRATVEALVERGYRVRVLARGTANLPDSLRRPQVEVRAGDVRIPNDITSALEGAAFCVNLAHGGGGASFEEIYRGMVDSALAIAKGCKAAGVSRLVHVGSIAGLYLGDPSETITHATPPDPLPAKRADYARAKALADRALIEQCRREALSLVVLRPGIVVGEGTPALHGGLGFFNNDQHVIGWNHGTNPLPFVLVSDVACATVNALRSPQAPGRTYNLVGDVRMSAREFVASLAAAQGRPIRFHPRSPWRLWTEDLLKTLIKRVGGRNAPLPSLRDFRSRAMPARFDTETEKRELDWQPTADRDAFVAAAIDIHRLA